MDRNNAKINPIKLKNQPTTQTNTRTNSRTSHLKNPNTRTNLAKTGNYGGPTNNHEQVPGSNTRNLANCLQFWRNTRTRHVNKHRQLAPSSGAPAGERGLSRRCARARRTMTSERRCEVSR